MWKNTYNPFSRGGPSSCLHEYASLRMRPINIFTSETMFSLKFQILLLFVELKSLSLLKGLHVLLRVWWIWELGRGWVLSLLTPEITAFHWDLLGTYPEPIPFLFPENSACGVLGPWGSHCSLSNRTSIWDLYDLTPLPPNRFFVLNWYGSFLCGLILQVTKPPTHATCHFHPHPEDHYLQYVQIRGN